MDPRPGERGRRGRRRPRPHARAHDLTTLPHIDDDRYSTHRYALLVTDPDDWVLLAQWVGFPMSILYWTITRQDLAARRFDRVAVQVHANP
ncbi:hypothetical protein ACFW40_15315 [Streptomyces sp. NPDC058807]|uniref:hypothetical protein n=1 Tax=unclassified Streptomyces TaxID=2593676 RepID=UPI003686D006